MHHSGRRLDVRRHCGRLVGTRSPVQAPTLLAQAGRSTCRRKTPKNSAQEPLLGRFWPFLAPFPHFCANLRRKTALSTGAAAFGVLCRIGRWVCRSAVCGCAKQRRAARNISFYRNLGAGPTHTHNARNVLMGLRFGQNRRRVRSFAELHQLTHLVLRPLSFGVLGSCLTCRVLKKRTPNAVHSPTTNTGKTALRAVFRRFWRFSDVCRL